MPRGRRSIPVEESLEPFVDSIEQVSKRTRRTSTSSSQPIVHATRTRRVSASERIEPPSTTFEGRENQLVNLASNLAEKQLREGTASSQVIVHYLKLGTTRERLEQERLRQENELLRAKTESYEAQRNSDALYKEALKMFRVYNGTDDGEDMCDEA